MRTGAVSGKVLSAPNLLIHAQNALTLKLASWSHCQEESLATTCCSNHCL